MKKKEQIKNKTEVDPRRIDMKKLLVDEMNVNVITTYDNDHDQQQWDIRVEVLKKRNRSLPKIQDTLQVNGVYSPEKHVLGQVINDIYPKNLKPHLLKISLFYNTMGEVIPSVYENRDVKNPNDRLEIEKEMDELGYGFITRTNSKYYFQPDQRDLFETHIMETFNTSSKVRNFSDDIGFKSEEERLEHQEIIHTKRIDTLKYFGYSTIPR